MCSRIYRKDFTLAKIGQDVSIDISQLNMQFITVTDNHEERYEDELRNLTQNAPGDNLLQSLNKYLKRKNKKNSNRHAYFFDWVHVTGPKGIELYLSNF